MFVGGVHPSADILLYQRTSCYGRKRYRFMPSGEVARTATIGAFAPRKCLFVNIDHDLASGVTAFERAIGFANGRPREMSGIDVGRDLAGFNQPCCVAQDVAAMGSA